jgi:hypothetical protein
LATATSFEMSITTPETSIRCWDGICSTVHPSLWKWNGASIWVLR